jgi:adenosylhomocysteine nucleosidase
LSTKVAIVAALEREVNSAVKHWTMTEREHAGRLYRFFETDRAVLVCGGIGSEAARRATEAIIALYQPPLVVSVGFAGALETGLKVGDSFSPRRVVDASDGSSVETGVGSGALVSVGSVAGVGQKVKLAKAYSAQAVDMEAAAVARGAHARNGHFAAFKAISDDSSFAMPPVEAFVSPQGKFLTARFLAFVALRPRLWGKVRRLANNSARAAQTLCKWLEQYNYEPGMAAAAEAGLHPNRRA